MKVRINSSWNKVLAAEFQKAYFLDLSNKVNQAYSQNSVKVFPNESEIFKAFELCCFEDTKIVILGQDPYPTEGHAHGLSFSVNDEVRPFPKSLNNIFKEISADLGTKNPSTGNLKRWAEQGVLLLNAVLTVEEGRPYSHKGIGWEVFTDEVIKMLSAKKEHVVFLLWGAKAATKEAMIDQSKHFILKAVHPSPLSAYRGFFGCKHFSKTNAYLRSNNLSIINW